MSLPMSKIALSAVLVVGLGGPAAFGQSIDTLVSTNPQNASSTETMTRSISGYIAGQHNPQLYQGYQAGAAYRIQDLLAQLNAGAPPAYVAPQPVAAPAPAPVTRPAAPAPAPVTRPSPIFRPPVFFGGGGGGWN